jgi:hypothetical protein
MAPRRWCTTAEGAHWWQATGEADDAVEVVSEVLHGVVVLSEVEARPKVHRRGSATGSLGSG